MFEPAVAIFRAHCAACFGGFKTSAHWQQLRGCLGPKIVRVARAGDVAPAELPLHAGRTTVGRADPREGGGKHIQLWRKGDDGKVSRILTPSPTRTPPRP